MNEWNASAPVVINTRTRQPKARRRWAVGLLASIAVIMCWSGAMLIVSNALWGYTILDMVPPTAMTVTGQGMIGLMIYLIAWRYGRLS